jgi:hypothetical protein
MTDELQQCSLCLLGLHDECLMPGYTDIDGTSVLPRCCCGGVDWSTPFGQPVSKRAGERVPKDPAEMLDPRSTGRKRAAEIAPIFTDMVCEWAYLKFAGGGVVPIIGCDGNLLRGQTKEGDGGDLHHGPDKNTLNNTPGVNLHRICKSCHHTWHGVNDPFYPGGRPDGDRQWLPEVEWVPHDGFTRATPEELAEANAARSSTNKKQRDVLPDVRDLL